MSLEPKLSVGMIGAWIKSNKNCGKDCLPRFLLSSDEWLEWVQKFKFSVFYPRVPSEEEVSDIKGNPTHRLYHYYFNDDGSIKNQCGESRLEHREWEKIFLN